MKTRSIVLVFAALAAVGCSKKKAGGGGPGGGMKRGAMKFPVEVQPVKAASLDTP